MEKRLLLAVVLMTAAIYVTNLLFAPPEPPGGVAGADSVIVESPRTATPAPAGTPAAPPAVTPPSLVVPQIAGAPADSVVVRSDRYRYVFSTTGAALRRAELLEYPSYSTPQAVVQLVPEDVADFLSYRLVVGGDTLDLRGIPFVASTRELDVGPDGNELAFRYSDPNGFGVSLTYRFASSGYAMEIDGRLEGIASGGAEIVTTLGPGLAYHEHPDHHSERELAVVSRVPGRVTRLPFRRVEARQTFEPGFTWAGLKDKYFLAALIAGEASPLGRGALEPVAPAELTVDGAEVVIPRVRLVSGVPVAADGSFSLTAYLGPQHYDQLRSVGYELEDVTPYGYRWLQPVIRPLAAAVLWVLNTLHDTLGIAYGWVLVIFGVMMRVVLWPLNAKAMRAQMKNMAVQPLIQEIRDKYGNDPQKQQEAMLSLYKEHGFNPFAGCLPLLVPFPVLITLFFVFQNTIAFRGAGFLWLPDLSLRDPLYILPLILVVSMFALQWVMAHLSGMEQNPQMKMMMYVMPVMMGVIFFMLPAGLNLYYAVTQLASIPQQVLISRERRRAQEELKRSGGPKLGPPAGKGRTKARR